MSESDNQSLKNLLEAALMVVQHPLSLEQMQTLIDPENPPSRKALRQALADLQRDFEGHGVELVEVASGWRFQTRPEYHARLGRLWEERPPRYSRALLETLALIAYRQPITRGEIEDIRGVSVSSQIIRTLMEREWIRVLGHRDVPGRPALLGTTRAFLDHFGLKSLEDLPSLQELMEVIPDPELDLPDPENPEPRARPEQGETLQ